MRQTLHTGGFVNLSLRKSMKLIIETSDLNDTFEDLIDHYNHLQFCVAWAGVPKSFDAGKLLCKHRNKVERGVVGLHFYQTDPQFIDEFLDCETIRYRKKTDGVFHDKIYLFYDSPKDWCAIIGSSNFTSGGFKKNNECNILISNDDINGAITFKSLKKHIETMWLDSELFTKKQLSEYEKCFNAQKGKQDSLARTVKSRSNIFLSSQLIHMTWDEYCALLNKNPRKDTLLKVLSYTTSIFKKYRNRSYGDMTELERRRICGADATDRDFECFGTNAKIAMLNQMIDGEKHIVKAIDSIPITGEITETQYNKYVELFCKSGWGDPLAGATRLLAMKRPDVFICVNGANIPKLADSLGFAKSTLSLDNYCERVVERIRQCSWYNLNDDTVGQEFWPYRVALLDAFYYTPKSEQ